MAIKSPVLDKNYLVKNSTITLLGRGMGVVSGLFLDALILAMFGLGKQTDAFFAALTIPFLLYSILEIEMPKILVPICARQSNEVDKRLADFHLNNFITVSIILLAAVSMTGSVLSGVFMPIQVPGIQSDVLKTAIQLSMILFWLVLIQGICAILRSLLFSYHRYIAASSTKIVMNFVVILIVVLLHSHIGIYSLAFGYLLGGMVALMFLMFAVRSDYQYSFVCKLKDQTLHETFKLLFFPLAGNMLGSIRIVIENFVASYLTSGNLSAVRYANRIISALSGVLMGSIVTAMLPLVSRYASCRNYDEMKNKIRNGIKLLALVAFPLCIWLVFTSESLLILLFERGEITRDNIYLISVLITLMTPTILFTRVNGIMQTMFYANMDVKKPIVSGVVYIVTFVMTSLALTSYYGVYSLPIAASLASVCGSIVMSVMLHRVYGPLGWLSLRGFGFRLLCVTIITAIAFKVGVDIEMSFSSIQIINNIISFAIPTVLGGASFIVSAILFRIIEYNRILSLVRTNNNVST